MNLRSTRNHEEIKNEVRGGKRRLVDEDVVLGSESDVLKDEELRSRSSSSASSASIKVVTEFDSENADPQQIVDDSDPMAIVKPEIAHSSRKASSIAKAPTKRTRTDKSSISERPLSS